jgi:hypothetical protein
MRDRTLVPLPSYHSKQWKARAGTRFADYGMEVHDIGATASFAAEYLTSRPWLSLVERLTGAKNLRSLSIATRRNGAGAEGVWIHTDNLGERRVTALVYLTPNRTREDAALLQIWERTANEEDRDVIHGYQTGRMNLLVGQQSVCADCTGEGEDSCRGESYHFTLREEVVPTFNTVVVFRDTPEEKKPTTPSRLISGGRGPASSSGLVRAIEGVL